MFYFKNIINSIPLIRDSISIGIINTDSQSALELAKNPVHHTRTKHIDIQYHFVRETLINGIIDIRYKSTFDLLADGLTKNLARPKFIKIVQGLGLRSRTQIN